MVCLINGTYYNYYYPVSSSHQGLPPWPLPYPELGCVDERRRRLVGEHLRLLVQKVLCLLLLRVEALALLLDDLDTLDLALALLIQLLESVGGRGGVRNVALVVRGLAAFATGHVMRLGSGCAAV